MRVLHLTTEFPPVIYGGLGTAVGGWVTATARSGVSVAVQLVEGPLVLGCKRGQHPLRLWLWLWLWRRQARDLPIDRGQIQR
jgi:hypothetical protein